MLLGLPFVVVLAALDPEVNNQLDCAAQRQDKECFYSAVEAYLSQKEGTAPDDRPPLAKEFIGRLETICPTLSGTVQSSCYKVVAVNANAVIEAASGEEKKRYSQIRSRALNLAGPKVERPPQKHAWDLLDEAKNSTTEEEYRKIGAELDPLLTKYFEPVAASGVWEQFKKIGAEKGFSYPEAVTPSDDVKPATDQREVTSVTILERAAPSAGTGEGQVSPKEPLVPTYKVADNTRKATASQEGESSLSLWPWLMGFSVLVVIAWWFGWHRRKKG